MCDLNKLEAAMLSGTLLRGKVPHIATEGFTASNGWIDSFKQQHNVVRKTVLEHCKSVILGE
jgi:hypothetical protein